MKVGSYARTCIPSFVELGSVIPNFEEGTHKHTEQ
jgi:hypothetical protein